MDCKYVNIVSDATVRKKWKGLRDYYRTELSKIAKPVSGSSAGNMRKSAWPHFHLMSFLGDTMKTRPRTTNLNKEYIRTQNTDSHAAENNEDTEDIVESQSETVGNNEICNYNVIDEIPDDTNENSSAQNKENPDATCTENINSINVNKRISQATATPIIKKRKTNEYDNFQKKMIEMELKKLEFIQNEKDDNVFKKLVARFEVSLSTKQNVCKITISANIVPGRFRSS